MQPTNYTLKYNGQKSLKIYTIVSSWVIFSISGNTAIIVIAKYFPAETFWVKTVALGLRTRAASTQLA